MYRKNSLSSSSESLSSLNSLETVYLDRRNSRESRDSECEKITIEECNKDTLNITKKDASFKPINKRRSRAGKRERSPQLQDVIAKLCFFMNKESK